MKKIIISITLLILAGTSISGQTKKITKEQFSEILRNSSDLMKTISYRQTRKMQTKSNGEVIMTETFIDEFSYPNKNRYIQTIEFEKNITRYESLNIDNVYYCKKSGNDWEVTESPCADDKTFNLGLKNIFSETFTLEDTPLNGQPNKLLKKVTKAHGSDESLGIAVEEQRKIWINKDGLIIREESVINNDSPDMRLSSNEITVYEYKPALTIENPKIKDKIQGKTVENETVENLIQKALAKKESLSYCQKTLIEDYADDGHRFLRKIAITENFIPPNRYSSVEIFEEDGKTTKTEFIRVGEKRLERMNEGKWGEPTPKFEAPFGERIEEIKKHTKSLGVEKLRNIDANVYEVFYKYKSSSRGNVEETNKYWFDENGLLLKKELKEVNLRDSTIRTVINEYDYDKKLKIELPK